MKNMTGLNRPIEEQLEILEKILLKNSELKEILEKLERSGLKDYYVCAGAVNQTVLNYYHDYEPNFGIKDYDIAYFDEDTSYESEDVIIKKLEKLVDNPNIKIDVKNQARVPLWFKDKFGYDIKPYTSLEEAISRWGTTITSLGVRLENGHLKVFAPYGLNDLFNMTLRPLVEGDYTKERYTLRSEHWKEKWPNLKVIPWQ